MFPITPDKASPSPLRVPMSVAEKAYSSYVKRYGRGQSLERIAERGGFYASEMDELHPGWREEASEITTLTAERDRLAAENAELRKWKSDLEIKVAAASKIGMDFGEMEFDAWFPGARPKTRKELTTALAAANATLDALRDLFGPDKVISNSTCMKAVAILNPQPAALAEENDNE